MRVWRCKLLKVQVVNLEAKNILMGVVSFLSFKIPESWRVFPIGVVEVESSRIIKGRKWAMNGYIMIGLCSDEGKEVLMEVKTSEPIRSFNLEKWMEKMKNVRSQGIIEVNGHKCGYKLRDIEKGLFRREKLVELKLCFFCDVTRRKIEIKLVGREEGDLSLFKNFLCDLSCH